jgi:hypothetical protein
MAKLSKDDLMAALKNAHAKQTEQAKPLKVVALKSPPVEKPVSLERLAIAICKTYEKRLKVKSTSR